MSWPPILVDEDFPVSVARVLCEQSTSPVEIVVDGDRRGLSDADQVAHAAATGAVLLSHNQLERGRFRTFVRRWRAQGNASVSVLFLPRDLDDQRLYLRTTLLLDWYSMLDDKPETLIWNDVAQPLIRGYRPVGFSEAEVRVMLGENVQRSSGNT